MKIEHLINCTFHSIKRFRCLRLPYGSVGKTDVYEGHTMSAVWPNPNDKINNAADSLETITD